MKVRAEVDVCESGVYIFSKGMEYDVIFEYDTVYELLTNVNKRRCYPKCFFTVVLEGDVE